MTVYYMHPSFTITIAASSVQTPDHDAGNIS